MFAANAVQSVFRANRLTADNLQHAADGGAILAHEREAVLSVLQLWKEHSADARDVRRRVATVCSAAAAGAAGQVGIGVLLAYTVPASNVLVIAPSADLADEAHEAFTHRREAFVIRRKLWGAEDAATVLPPSFGTQAADRRSFGAAIRSGRLHYHAPPQQPQTLLVVNYSEFAGGGAAIQLDSLCAHGDAFDLVIVNEAQLYTASVWQTLVERLHGRIVFITNTPNAAAAEYTAIQIYE